MRYTIISDRMYYPPMQPCIDQAAWQERSELGQGPDQYFITDFTKPPTKPGRAGEMAGFLIGQLNYLQYQQQVALQMTTPDVAPRENMAWLEYVVRCGVKAVEGLEIQKLDGTVEPVVLDFEEGPQGRMLTAQSWQKLLPFGLFMMQLVGSIIFYQSSGQSSPTAASAQI